MKLRKRHKTNLPLCIIIIVINIFLIFNFVGKKITPYFESIIMQIINENIYDIIFNSFSYDTFADLDYTDIIVINKNKDDEIISVDYNMKNTYALLSGTLDNLYKTIKNLKINSKYYDAKRDIFNLPLGVISNNILLSRVGSKIPCKVDILSDTHVSLKTRLTEYGINNSLVEIYINIDVKNNLINPFVEESYTNNYEVLVASRLVLGSIPNYYGGVIERNSNIISS